MIEKFAFHLDSYTEGGGNSEEEDTKPPRNCVVTITSEYAKYILRRIALLRQVRKVDEMAYSMHYAFHEASWCYDVHFQNDVASPVDIASTTQDYMVVMAQEIVFICYHESSGQCLATERIGYTALKKLAAGKPPFTPDMEIDEEEEQANMNVAVGTWTPPTLGSVPSIPANPQHLTPMQMLQQATQQHPQQLINLPNPPQEVVEIQFDTAMPQWMPPLPTPEPENDESDNGDPGESDEG